ncbi:hypothetical protein BC835DRAFT_1422930 [Cytidiella melzeri]|nr:hypothetical protein BC835DRAFT_1422930 [Cytidiella melzeri]
MSEPNPFVVGPDKLPPAPARAGSLKAHEEFLQVAAQRCLVIQTPRRISPMSLRTPPPEDFGHAQDGSAVIQTPRRVSVVPVPLCMIQPLTSQQEQAIHSVVLRGPILVAIEMPQAIRATIQENVIAATMNPPREGKPYDIPHFFSPKMVYNGTHPNYVGNQVWCCKICQDPNKMEGRNRVFSTNTGTTTLRSHATHIHKEEYEAKIEANSWTWLRKHVQPPAIAPQPLSNLAQFTQETFELYLINMIVAGDLLLAFLNRVPFRKLLLLLRADIDIPHCTNGRDIVLNF